MADPTVNELFLDAMIRHQVYLMRLSGSVRDKVLALLDATERDIAEAIIRRINDKKGFDAQAASRLRVLQGIITRIRSEAWDKAGDIWLRELRDLSVYEPEFMSNAIKAIAPVIIDTVLPPAAQLKALVKTQPFEGKVMSDWASTVRSNDLNRIMSQIQIGMVQGESSADIARRVVGLQSDKGVSGITELTRREVDSVTRTAVNAISNASRREFVLENQDLFDYEMFVATLDSRTTPICRSLDGKRFEVGKGPIPPLHYGCRSTRVAILDGEALGNRPSKPFSERQLVEEYAAENDLGDGLKTRDDLPRGTKTDYDRWRAGRVRDLTGTVPSKMTYQQWLMRQSAAFQDDVLGKARGALFRRGGLTLDRFVNRQGDQITLHDLVQRERKAFIDAGLDPNEF